MVGARGATVDSLGRGSPQGANPLVTTANHGRCYHVLRNADFAQRVGSSPTPTTILMRRYTVGVAGQTVNLLPNGSGCSTHSRRTNFK